MVRTFIGIEGHYEIDDEGKIAFKATDDSGNCIGEVKHFRTVKHIRNDADRNGVLHLLQLMRIYKTIGPEYLKVQA